MPLMYVHGHVLPFWCILYLRNVVLFIHDLPGREQSQQTRFLYLKGPSTNRGSNLTRPYEIVGSCLQVSLNMVMKSLLSI